MEWITHKREIEQKRVQWNWYQRAVSFFDRQNLQTYELRSIIHINDAKNWEENWVKYIVIRFAVKTSRRIRTKCRMQRLSMGFIQSRSPIIWIWSHKTDLIRTHLRVPKRNSLFSRNLLIRWASENTDRRVIIFSFKLWGRI